MQRLWNQSVYGALNFTHHFGQFINATCHFLIGPCVIFEWVDMSLIKNCHLSPFSDAMWWSETWIYHWIWLVWLLPWPSLTRTFTLNNFCIRSQIFSFKLHWNIFFEIYVMVRLSLECDDFEFLTINPFRIISWSFWIILDHSWFSIFHLLLMNYLHPLFLAYITSTFWNPIPG